MFLLCVLPLPSSLSHTHQTLLAKQAKRKAVIGDRVRHPKRGPGTVVAMLPDDEGEMRTHVQFDRSGDTHRYRERSWAKMEQTEGDDARDGREDGGSEDQGEIGTGEFARGLIKALRKDPNGAVAQWIIKELQNEAALWKMETVEDGMQRWSHPQKGMVMARPQILIETARCDAVLGIASF